MLPLIPSHSLNIPQITAQHILLLLTTGLASEALSRTKVPRKLKPQFQWEHITRQVIMQREKRGESLSGLSEGFSGPGLVKEIRQDKRAGAFPYTLFAPFIPDTSLPCEEIWTVSLFFSDYQEAVLWKEMMEGTQPTGNSREVSCAFSLAGTRLCADALASLGRSWTPGDPEATWSPKWWPKGTYRHEMENTRSSSRIQ